MQALLGGKSVLFQLVLTKLFRSELFSCLPKVDHVITVKQKAYCGPRVAMNWPYKSYLI